jgi:hypothetical protein
VEVPRFEKRIHTTAVRPEAPLPVAALPKAVTQEENLDSWLDGLLS